MDNEKGGMTSEITANWATSKVVSAFSGIFVGPFQVIGSCRNVSFSK